MHVETAGLLFDMRRARKFSRVCVCVCGGGGHLQTSVGPAPYKWSRHKSIKMGQSWHRFLLLVHWYIQRPEQDLTILINLRPQILGLLRLYFPLSREKMMVGPGTVSVRLGRLL